MTAHETWVRYCLAERHAVEPILKSLGFALDREQVHTVGERYLMVGERDVGGGGYKLVLLGTRARDGRRVVIKASSTVHGKREIETERRARETVRRITFAYGRITVPEELLYAHPHDFVIFITEYIDQETTFLSRPIAEQFALALSAFKVQEGFHATTASHAKQIKATFGVWDADTYVRSFDAFVLHARERDSKNTALTSAMDQARAELVAGRDTIEQYCSFLTHADFVPHNFRVAHGVLYLLDSASLHFGNKYESWARFMNFMLLYSRPLEEALASYVRDNRTRKESDTLRLLRIYKIGALLDYYTGTLTKTESGQRMLSERRIAFWLSVLESFLANAPLGETHIEEYRRDRDTLRSKEEQERQKALH